MKAYGSKKCLIMPCTCCNSEAKSTKFTNNKSRARQKAKKEIENAKFQDSDRGKKERIR